MLYSFGHDAEIEPGVPVFLAVRDLSGALRLRLDDPDVTAYPVFAGARLRCASDGIVPRVLPGPYSSDERSARHAGGRYGATALLEAGGGELAVGDRAACRTQLTQVRPGRPPVRY